MKMAKPWIGYLAVAFLFLAGVLEFIGGHPRLGILLVVLSFISLGLRIYFNRKIRDQQNGKL